MARPDASGGWTHRVLVCHRDQPGLRAIRGAPRDARARRRSDTRPLPEPRTAAPRSRRWRRTRAGHLSASSQSRAGSRPWPSVARAPSFVSLNSRTFSMAITAWSAKVLRSSIWLGRRTPGLGAPSGQRADGYRLHAGSESPSIVRDCGGLRKRAARRYSSTSASTSAMCIVRRSELPGQRRSRDWRAVPDAPIAASPRASAHGVRRSRVPALEPIDGAESLRKAAPRFAPSRRTRVAPRSANR